MDRVRPCDTVSYRVIFTVLKFDASYSLFLQSRYKTQTNSYTLSYNSHICTYIPWTNKVVVVVPTFKAMVINILHGKSCYGYGHIYEVNSATGFI